MNCQRRWPGTTPDMQTKFFLLFFGHKCLPFSLTCKSEFLWEIKKNEKKSASIWDREIEKNLTIWRKKNGRVLNCMKLEYYKEVLNFGNIKYHIIFLIIQISGQQCHVGDSLRTGVHWTWVLFRTQFCETQV